MTEGPILMIHKAISEGPPLAGLRVKGRLECGQKYCVEFDIAKG